MTTRDSHPPMSPAGAATGPLTDSHLRSHLPVVSIRGQVTTAATMQARMTPVLMTPVSTTGPGMMTESES